MTWLEEEERQIRIEEIVNRKKPINKRLEMYKNIKLLLMLIFISGIFALDAKQSQNKKQQGCDYTIVTCVKCGYEYYREAKCCPCCGTYRGKK